MNLHVHIFSYMCARVLSRAYLRSYLLCHRIHEGTNLEGNVKLFYRVVAPISNLISKARALLLIHPFKQLKKVRFFFKDVPIVKCTFC